MTDLITLKALVRLSPRMALYHAKRIFRNKLSAKFPSAYASHINNMMARVPTLGTDVGHLTMAKEVAWFYDQAYADKAVDAAKGRFNFLSQEVDFGSASAVNWHHKVSAEQDFHLWRQKLNHMGFICPMLIRGDEEQLGAVVDFILGFRQQASFGHAECFSSAWFPYSASHRILAIMSGYLIARETRDLPENLQTLIEAFLQWNAAFVLANIEHELKNNHVERNLAALCFYYTHAKNVPAGIAQRLDRVVAELVRDTLLPDGLSAERSAMYQGMTVMSLQVFANTPFLTAKTLALVTHRLHHAKRAWFFMTHPDGEIALFNDSWFGEIPSPTELLAKEDFERCEVLRDAGYGRFQQGDIFALFDAGPIGPSWNPGHGHADFLSLELDVAGIRFIVDPGTYQYSTGPRRIYDRAAESHNGPSIKGQEPVTYKGAFRVGTLASARLLCENISQDTLAGELIDKRDLLRRKVTLSEEVIYVQDTWATEKPAAYVRILVPHFWQIVEHDVRTVLFAHAGIQTALVVTCGEVSSVTDGQWSCRYLQDLKAHVIELVPLENANLEWNVSRRR